MSKVTKWILICFHALMLLYMLLMTCMQILAFHFDGLLGNFGSLTNQIIAATATCIGTFFAWWMTATWFVEIEKK